MIVRVVENDLAGIVVTESGGATAVPEGGASDTYDLVLHSHPTTDVIVRVEPDGQIDLGSGAGAPTQLTFTSANWSTPQPVTVAAVNDDIEEGPHSATIGHTVVSGDAKYDGKAVSNVTVMIADDDQTGGTDP